MSLVIKMDSIKTAEHLTKGIHYIMQDWKTKGMAYSNSGVSPEEILSTFQLTKEAYTSHGTREGYHYKFSFSKDENISKEDALAFIADWTEAYLGDDYDWVMSVHHDRDHTHMHLIFNSTKRGGGKYRYEKGDWDRVIRPLTNSLAQTYHTGELKEKEKTLDYSPAKTLHGIVMQDMEACMNQSDSYTDFKKRMVKEFHYELREGVSKNHGVYLSLKPPGKAKAVRTYSLPKGFTPADINQKIEERKNKGVSTREEKKSVAVDKQLYRTVYRHGKKRSSFIPYKNLSFYQKQHVRQMLQARDLYRRTGSSLKMHEQSIRAIHDMRKETKLVYDFGIRDKEDISILRLSLQKQEAVIRNKMEKEPCEEQEKKTEELEKLRGTIKELKRLEKKEKDKERQQDKSKNRKDVTHG